tara:strand:- start:44 stop:322 length:279 start_codon:yes stop_codon:yes gene_type:complete
MIGRTDESFIPGVYISPLEPGPCAVCGHPTGDCSADDHLIKFIEEPIDEDSFLVEEDVIQRKWISSNHLAKVLVVPAGKRISRSEAEKLGLI